MKQKLNQLLTPPQGINGEAARRYVRMSIMLWIALGVTLPIGFVHIILSPPKLPNLLAFLLLELIGVTSLLVLRHGRIHLAGFLFALYLNGGITLAAFLHGGLYRPLLLTTILLIPPLGYLVGGRQGTFFAILTALEIFAFYLFDDRQSALSSPYSSELWLIFSLVNLCIATFSLYFISMRIQKAFALAQRKEQELEQKILEMQAFQTSLEERITLRTREIDRQRQYFEALVLHSPLAIAVVDPAHKVLLCNPAFEKLFGYELVEMQGRDLDEFVSNAETYSQAKVYTDLASHGKQVVAKTTRRRRDGNIIDVEIYGVPVMIDGELIGMLSIYNDITEHNKTLATLQDREQLFRSFFEYAAIGMMITDPDGKIQKVNQALADMLGYPILDLTNLNVSNLIYPEDSSNHQSILNELIFGYAAVARSEIRFVHQKGHPIWGWLNMSIVRHSDGKPGYLISQIQDITERKEFEKKLHHLATHDPLTDLPNRALFFDRLEHAIQLAQRNKQYLAILFMDLDGYKAVNDRYGHLIGDQFLQSLSRKLQSVLRQSDTLAQIGGDEFAFLIENLKDTGQVAVIVEKILMAISQPLRINHEHVGITASIGVSIYPTHGNDPQSLIVCADQAMYSAKERGKNQIVYYDFLEK